MFQFPICTDEKIDSGVCFLKFMLKPTFGEDSPSLHSLRKETLLI